MQNWWFKKLVPPPSQQSTTCWNENGLYILASYLCSSWNWIFQEVLPLSRLFFDKRFLHWYETNFSRGSSTKLLLFLCSTQLWGDINKPINFFLLRSATESGCHGIIFTLWFFGFFKECSRKKSSYQNCGIFHDFNIGLFWRHPGQYGNPWSLTGIYLNNVNPFENNNVKRDSNLIGKIWVESRQKTWVKMSQENWVESGWKPWVHSIQ